MIRLVLLLILCFMMPTASYALSCIPPEGDQVEKEITEKEIPIWFGTATMKSFDQENDTAVFTVNETFLTNGEDYFEEEIEVFISKFFMTWGPFYGLDNKELPPNVKADHGIGKTNKYYFIYQPEFKIWGYGGPGGCTFFTDENWQKLQNGDYKELLKPYEEGHDHAH